MKTTVGPYLKAIVAGSLAGLTQLYTALADSKISPQEWVTVAIWAITAAAAIYGVPNTPTLPNYQIPDNTAPAPTYSAPPAQFPAAAVTAAQQATVPASNLAPGA